ncbi:MAG: hypothetical protein ACF787_08770, partial [Rhodopirellula sp. JB053]
WGTNTLDDLVERLEIERISKKFEDERISKIFVPHHVRDTIYMQFRALGYLVAAGDNEWQLTPYGDRYFTTLTGIAKDDTPEPNDG